MAKSNPKLDWFVNDWLSDPCVQRSSMPARGCWHEMLQYMTKMEPFGELRNPDGSPMTTGDIAELLKQHKGSVSRWLKELERNGVFSRTEDGAIYNRRMVRARQNGVGIGRHKRKIPPKSPDREHVSDQQLELGISHTPRTQTQAATLPLETPSPSLEPEADSSTPRACADQAERQNKQDQSSGEARCARLDGPAGPPPRVRTGPRGQSRGRPPPYDQRARAAKRHQVIVNLVEWLKINSLGSADKQLAARQMLGRARLALDDWKARSPEDKALFEESLALMRASPVPRCREPAADIIADQTRRMAAIWRATMPARPEDAPPRWRVLPAPPPLTMPKRGAELCTPTPRLR